MPEQIDPILLIDRKEKFVFLKMASTKRRKFFKMSSEERLELYNQMKTAVTRPTKGSVGAAKTGGARKGNRA